MRSRSSRGFCGLHRLGSVTGLLVVGVLACPGVGLASAQITREEALAAVYPSASIKSERIFLTAEQQREAAALAGVSIPSALIARYIAVRDGIVVGRAYIDTHIVRTKRESLLISLDEKGAVRRVEVTAFQEPPEYQAPSVWLEQFRGRSLSGDLQLHRAIRPIAGATLTATAATQSVRRVLAIDRVLEANRAGGTS